MMKEDFSHSDQKLREKLGAHRIPAPEGAWEGIEQQLSGTSRKRRGFFLLGFLAFLLIGGLAAYVLFPSVHTSGKTGGEHQKTSLSSSNSSVTTGKNGSQSSQTSGKMQPNTKSVKHQNTATSSSASTINHTSANYAVAVGGNGNHAKPTDNGSGGTFKGKESNPSIGTSGAGTHPTDGSDKTPKEPELENQPEHAQPELSAETETQSPSDEQLPGYLVPRANTQLTESYVESLEKNKLDKTPKISRGGWSVETGGGMSTFSYMAKSGTPELQSTVKDAQTGEQGLGGFLRVNYQPWKLLSLHTGVELEQESYDVTATTYTSTTITTVDTTGWYFDSIQQQQVPILDTVTLIATTPQNQTYANQSTYLYIPLGIMFHLRVGTRSELGFRIGGSMGIRTKGDGQVITDEAGNTIALNDAYKKVGNYQFRASVRYSFTLNEHHTVFVEPWYGMGLNNRSNPALPYTTRFRNTGFNVGLKYNF